MSPKPTAKQLAAMDQGQLAELSKREPALVSQFLLMQQGLRTNTEAPAGAPPRIADAYLFNSRQDYKSPTGHPMGSMNRASDDAVRVDELIRSHGQSEPTVLSEMGNELGKKMSSQSKDNESRSGLATFYKRKYYGEGGGR